jgi:hypothetical protein
VINIVLDASMLDTIQTCEWKFNQRYNENRTALRKAHPLDRGECLHIGEEIYWNSLKNGIAWETAVNSGLMHIRIALTKSDMTSEQGERVLEVFEENHTFWKTEDLGMQILEVEKPFAYVLWQNETYRLIMIGKIDLIVSDNKDPIKIIDHKGYDRDFPIKRWQNQGCNYCNALSVHYIWFNRIGFQTSLKLRDKHRRIPVTYDSVYLAQWRDEVIRWALRYYEDATNNDWPRNPTSCDKFNRLCEYYEVCDTSGEENRIYKLKNNFNIAEKWDPTKSMKKSTDLLKEVIENAKVTT